ncbi:hypothetical protein [Haloechinothrix sp. LS1_15]|uniref:hypothetical protein n=1 Tax=Haloechinothrix sp. LS1_15 TaxID=2652248 RepID=UPI002946BC57|nr:hypothetical protein [Haloechinothrix sp. LS1_15]MDV6014015.1 hypothetical protein [Haloechinothrix sp. LS1_15]
MSVTPTVHQHHSGVLAPVGQQFPLARPIFDFPPSETVPADAATPFGLRFFDASCPVNAMTPVSYEYSSRLQVAVATDGSETPLVTMIESWDKTTTGSADGNREGIEEWTMDYCGDQQS